MCRTASGRPRRFAAVLVGCLGVLLALPFAARGQGISSYSVVRPWPEPGTKGQDDYGWIDVTGVAVGKDGRVYMCQGVPSHHKVLVFSPGGELLDSWGAAVMYEPHSIRVDADGNLWVVDYDLQLIFKFDPNGQLLLTLGHRKKRSIKPGFFSGPTDIAFAPNGDLYVSQWDGDAVAHLTHDGRWVNVWGRGGNKPGQFHAPHSIAVDAQSRVYVADRQNHRIQIFASDGRFLSMWKNQGSIYNLFITPSQHLYVSNGRRGTIDIYNVSGSTAQVLGRFGKWGRDPGEMTEPHGMYVTGDGTLYEADGNGKRLQKFVPGG